MLVDEVKITVRAGKGGNGSVSFIRNGQTAWGGPDGGNGGKGGDLYVAGEDNLNSLSQFMYIKSISAEDGVNGSKQNLTGRNGKDKIFYVPLGTQITDLDTKETIEIINPHEKILLAKGGKGGRGNNEFKSATVQAPRYREVGEEGEIKHLFLELKLIADIGLIGLPNSGKSSLLEALTNAHPKIGNYPFTTLEPNLGAFDSLVIADIPGLIEGASIGKGLGDKFLKHIEKTKILLHCVDLVSTDLKKDYGTIRKELEVYNPSLIDKTEILLLTKSDLVDEQTQKKQLTIGKKLNKNATIVSIYDDGLLGKLKKTIKSYLEVS